MTDEELMKHARALSRLRSICEDLSTAGVWMVCEVAESLLKGEVRVEEEKRQREEATNVH